MVVFFVYTGLEMSLSQSAFTVLTELRGVAPGPAGIAVAVYWGSIGLGRVVFGLISDRVGIDRLVRNCLLVAVAGVLVNCKACWRTGLLIVWSAAIASSHLACGLPWSRRK